MAAKNSEVEPADPAHAARKKNLDLALQQIAKDYGEGAIMRLGDDHVLPVEGIPTGKILIERAAQEASETFDLLAGDLNFGHLRFLRRSFLGLDNLSGVST